MNCARLNFSHGTHATHKVMYDKIRKVAKEEGRSLAILQDLQGPKIRTGLLERGVHVNLINDEKIWITTKSVVGTAERISTSYKNIVNDVKKGSRVLIDDGRLELKVLKVEGDQFLSVVVVGGMLGQNWTTMGVLVVGCYGVLTLFSLITLPVEFDASSRALSWIEKNGVVTSKEHYMAKDALKWASLTYVVAALGSLVTLLYFVSIFLGGRD